jgi:hypothetical protein
LRRIRTRDVTQQAPVPDTVRGFLGSLFMGSRRGNLCGELSRFATFQALTASAGTLRVLCMQYRTEATIQGAENRNSSSMLSWSSSASPRLCVPIPYSYYRFVTVPQTRSGLPGRIALVILRTGRSPPVALHAGLRRRSYDSVTEPDSAGSGEDLHRSVHEDFRTHGPPCAGSAFFSLLSMLPYIAVEKHLFVSKAEMLKSRQGWRRSQLLSQLPLYHHLRRFE